MEMIEQRICQIIRKIEELISRYKIIITWEKCTCRLCAIFPWGVLTLICVMYGFINERSWQYDNGISGCNFILLVHSVIMDAVYMKFYMIFLVIKVVCISYAKYDELAQPIEVEWKRCFTTVYLSILLAIATALTHWLMTAIIGVRIYVDAFSTKKDDTNSSIPDTGDYRVAPLTGYMIGCAILLSWITYIIINKLWFYKVYSAIH